MNPAFWKNRRVLITGNTGFKGSWLGVWLDMLGAKPCGYSLNPPTKPSMYKQCGLAAIAPFKRGDVRSAGALMRAVKEAAPEIIFHMAAQPLVLESYRSPAKAFAANLMGTVNLLDAARACGGVKAVVVVTTDKCYEQPGSGLPFAETDRLGGDDPYSASKACAEVAAASYIKSFFNTPGSAAVATVRAGNVIGGGDWAPDRLLPDCMRALAAGREIVLRRPDAVRPWQHVLEPLAGYLALARALCDDRAFCGAWNFGPDAQSHRTVRDVVGYVCGRYGASFRVSNDAAPHEAAFLALDSSKARRRLGWRPVWGLEAALDRVVEWTRAFEAKKDLLAVTRKQIEDYQHAARH